MVKGASKRTGDNMVALLVLPCLGVWAGQGVGRKQKKLSSRRVGAQALSPKGPDLNPRFIIYL